MKRYTHQIAAVLLFTFFSTLFIPVAPAQAAQVTSPTTSTQSSSGSSSGFINILLALLLGKFLGTSNSSNTSTDTISSVLGAAAGSKTTGTANTKGADIVKNAQKYMGVPYVWGGTVPTGWDCSGYTQYVMKESGITIPRTAAEQFAKGVAVNKNDLQVGDMVFFTTYKPGASHVGFYLGDNKFIHASSAAKEVTINSLTETYYTERYIGARRYIQ
ncbi:MULTISPECIES: C40 family peptidase [Sporomusa]|uniref:C40 family peptidase n=1 Tax=Sporomusa TaxID=2375 RepID=UPI002CC0EA60|nr:C40 family peptidase [Sporomusa sphaeroides]HML33464.1 C40 family peptidase [Sporomusa sphaeroides]